MKIYLFRHAQKAMDFSGDPDLTAEGHAQASKVLDKVLKHELPQPTALWVSPKKRTRNTFRPLSEHFSLPLQSNEDLLEQKSDETVADFRQRIQKFFEDAMSQKHDVLFICSHYDFVVEAMSLLPSDTDLSRSEFAHWNPCQYIGFSLTADGIYEYLEMKKVQL